MERNIVISGELVGQFVIKVGFELDPALIKGYCMTKCLDTGIVFSEGGVLWDETDRIDGVTVVRR